MKLLKLPYLVQVQILKHFQLYEIFFLGICSKRAQRLVQMVAPKYDYAIIDTARGCVEVQKIGLAGPKIVMYSEKNKPENLHLRDENSFWNERIRLSFKDKTIRCRISMHPTKHIPILWCNSKYTKILPLAIHNTICKVFNSSPEIQIICLLDKLDDFPDTNEVYNIRECLTFDTYNYGGFFERVRVKNLMKITRTVPIELGSSFWSIKHIYFNLAWWLLGVHLLEFKGVSAVLRDARRITNGDLVVFMKTWENGGFENLESVLICAEKTWSTVTFDREQILSHFNVFPWDPKMRAARFMYPPNWRIASFSSDLADCREGMDMIRECDGRLATVIISSKEFKFFVWKNGRHPDPLVNRPIIKNATSEDPQMFVIGKVMF